VPKQVDNVSAKVIWFQHLHLLTPPHHNRNKLLIDPELNTRMQIMQNKIPFISPEAIGQLCEQYKLTGGQVANIAKKCSIYEMLEGKEADKEKVDEFCREELGLREKVKLGF